MRRVLAADPELWLSVSATTRAPRPGEIHGTDYIFVTADEFASLVADGGLLEWAEFAGNKYGTPAAPVRQRMAAGVDVILEIDLQGVRQVRTNLPQARTVFVAPPSPEVLRDRLSQRGTEDAAAIDQRLCAARGELAAAGEFDCVIVNDDLDAATNQLLAWVHEHAN